MTNDEFKALEHAVREGDVDVVQLWERFAELHRKASSVDYAYALLKQYDTYASGGLDGCVREVLRVVQEMDARIDELHRSNTETENARRMWKARAEAARKGLHALILMFTQRFGADDMEALQAVKELTDRVDNLERDVWNKAVGLVRVFLTDAEEPMGDYAPDLVRPVDDPNPLHGKPFVDPHVMFIRRWRDRFKAAIEG